MVNAATLLLENIPQKIITFQIERIKTPEGETLAVKLRTPRADEYGEALAYQRKGTFEENQLEIYARLIANCIIDPTLREADLNDAIAGYKGGMADPYLIVNTIFTLYEIHKMGLELIKGLELGAPSIPELKKKAKY